MTTHANEVLRLAIAVGTGFDDFRVRYEESVPSLDQARLDALVRDGADWDAVLGAAAENAPHDFIRYWTFDFGALMRLAGDSPRCATYLMGNHTIAERMYRHDPAIGLYAPLGTLIHEDAEGTAWFTVDQPSTRFGSFGDRRITEVGLELDQKLAALLEHLGAPVPSALTGGAAAPVASHTTTAEAEQTKSVGRRLEGPVAVVTMRHPPHNLLDRELSEQLVAALSWAVEQGARSVVLESGLRHFSAGANLDAMLAAAEQGDGVLGWGLVDVLRAFEELPIPIVAAVHGVCVGGGLELALACDVSIAAESAKLGCVEVAVGLHPLMGAIQRITQRAGAARAKEMALLGRRYDARTLERWNVLNRVVPDEKLRAAAMSLARELASGPPVAHAATKALVSIAVEQGVRAADEAMEGLQRPIFRSRDFHEAVASYRDNGAGMVRFEGR